MAKKSGTPRSVELLWGEPERPSRGPKPGLTVAGIVRAAIAIADADGIGAMSMQRVAAGFGFTTMSLYRYVPGKSELIDLMIDEAVGPTPDLSAISGGWRAQLTEWAHQTRACFQRHPWFLPVAMRRIMGPNQLGWLESAVAALSGHGLVGAELLSAVLVVNGYVRSMAPFMGEQPAAPGELTGEQWGMAIFELIDTHRNQFPALTAAIADGAFGPSEHDDLDFGLQRVLDGIEIYLQRKAARE
jgi:AcrR family transcriptional regulator